MKIVKRMLCVSAAVAIVLSLVLMTSCNSKKQPVYSNDARIEFPVERSVTLTWWYDYNEAYYTGDFTTLDEHPFMKYMEQKTNVKIEFVQPTTDNASNELMTLIASGDVCDMVTHNWYRPSTEGSAIDALIDEEIYQCLNDPTNNFIDVQMENFNAMREEYSVIDKIIVTGQNNIIWIPRLDQMYDYMQPTNTDGLVMRKDYLDELQLDVPVTIADWEEVLEGFLTLGVQVPLSMGTGFGMWCTMANDVFLTAYNVKIETYRDPETDRVAYGATSDGVRNYVTLMRDWVARGLAKQVNVNETNKLTDKYVGSWSGNADEIVNLKAKSTDESFELVGVPDPVLNVGDKIVMRNSYRPIGCASLDSVFVSYTCENGPLVCRYMDEFFTEESYMRTSYGVEGDDYTVDSDGKVTFTEKITGNTDGIRYGIYQNCFMESFYKYPYVLIDYVYDDATLAAIAEWSKSEMTYSFIDRLCIAYTEAEQEVLDRLNVASAVVGTYGFVNGNRELSEWDDYVAAVNEAGVDEYLAVLQSAWDRFLAA